MTFEEQTAKVIYRPNFLCPFLLGKNIDKIFEEINSLYSGSYEDYKEKSKTFKDFLKLLRI